MPIGKRNPTPTQQQLHHTRVHSNTETNPSLTSYSSLSRTEFLDDSRRQGGSNNSTQLNKNLKTQTLQQQQQPIIQQNQIGQERLPAGYLFTGKPSDNDIRNLNSRANNTNNSSNGLSQQLVNSNQLAQQIYGNALNNQSTSQQSRSKSPANAQLNQSESGGGQINNIEVKKLLRDIKLPNLSGVQLKRKESKGPAQQLREMQSTAGLRGGRIQESQGSSEYQNQHANTFDISFPQDMNNSNTINNTINNNNNITNQSINSQISNINSQTGNNIKNHHTFDIGTKLATTGSNNLLNDSDRQEHIGSNSFVFTKSQILDRSTVQSQKFVQQKQQFFQHQLQNQPVSNDQQSKRATQSAIYKQLQQQKFSHLRQDSTTKASTSATLKQSFQIALPVTKVQIEKSPIIQQKGTNNNDNIQNNTKNDTQSQQSSQLQLSGNVQQQQQQSVLSLISSQQNQQLEQVKLTVQQQQQQELPQQQQQLQDVRQSINGFDVNSFLTTSQKVALYKKTKATKVSASSDLSFKKDLRQNATPEPIRASYDSNLSAVEINGGNNIKDIMSNSGSQYRLRSQTPNSGIKGTSSNNTNSNGIFQDKQKVSHLKNQSVGIGSQISKVENIFKTTSTSNVNSVNIINVAMPAGQIGNSSNGNNGMKGSSSSNKYQNNIAQIMNNLENSKIKISLDKNNQQINSGQNTGNRISSTSSTLNDQINSSLRRNENNNNITEPSNEVMTHLINKNNPNGEITPLRKVSKRLPNSMSSLDGINNNINTIKNNQVQQDKNNMTNNIPLVTPASHFQQDYPVSQNHVSVVRVQTPQKVTQSQTETERLTYTPPKTGFKSNLIKIQKVQFDNEGQEEYESSGQKQLGRGDNNIMNNNLINNVNEMDDDYEHTTDLKQNNFLEGEGNPRGIGNSSQNNQLKQLQNIDEQQQQQKLSHSHNHRISKIEYKTKAGCNYNGPKTNQDNFIIVTNVNSRPDRFIFSVCDGHGVNGHYCSAFLRRILPQKIELALAREIDNTDDDFIENSLSLGFLQASKELLESNIDCTFSGSTCVLLLVIGNKMWSANAGDSRAIICGSTQEGWYLRPLSRDHKPDDPDEYLRIMSRGGRVETYRDENNNQVGPYRVWLHDENIPGLAMARSFGDVIASQVGVTCEPEVALFEIGKEDRFIILASDGVWEFLSNEEVMSLIVPCFESDDPAVACARVVKASVASWKQNDEVIDDITCVIIFLK